jgi:hypothetical protein
MPRLATKQIAQDGATNNQGLVWNSSTSRWEPQTLTVAFLGFGANNVATTTTARSLWPWYVDALAPTGAIQFRVPRACTIRNLRVRHNTVGVSANAIVYTLRKNSVATAVTCSIAANASDGSDLVNSDTFAAGDLIDIRVTKALAITTSPLNITATLEAVS